MKTIIQHFFNGKSAPVYFAIRTRKSVIPLNSSRLFIGRTPGRFIEILGHRTGEELSIQDALEKLDANRAAQRVFPLAATPGSHWIYFGLFSSCRKNPGVLPLKQYIEFLREKLGRRNAGVGIRLFSEKYTSRKVSALSERFRSVHDIRRRIDDLQLLKKYIKVGILARLDKLVRSGRYEAVNYRELAKAFRYAWLNQSKVLIKNNHATLVKKEEPSITKIKDDDLLRIYAGYWLIRALYGVDIKDSEGEDGKGRAKVTRLNEQHIKKAARLARYYLNPLLKQDIKLHEEMTDVLSQLTEAEATGEPPKIQEYYKRQADNRRILNGFRLTRFRAILRQLDEAVKMDMP